MIGLVLLLLLNDVVVKDEGVSIGPVISLNCVGDAITCTKVGTGARIYIDAGTAGADTCTAGACAIGPVGYSTDGGAVFYNWASANHTLSIGPSYGSNGIQIHWTDTGGNWHWGPSGGGPSNDFILSQDSASRLLIETGSGNLSLGVGSGGNLAAHQINLWGSTSLIESHWNANPFKFVTNTDNATATPTNPGFWFTTGQDYTNGDSIFKIGNFSDTASVRFTQEGNVIASGTVTGSTLSGTNTGDQTKTCPASNFVSTIATGTGSTCTQPSYTDLAGTSPIPTQNDGGDRTTTYLRGDGTWQPIANQLGNTPVQLVAWPRPKPFIPLPNPFLRSCNAVRRTNCLDSTLGVNK